MIQQLKSMEQYLLANKMQSTLKSLRSQLLSKYPQAPSSQFHKLFDQKPEPRKQPGKNVELTNPNTSRKQKIQQKMRSEAIMEGLLGKIAYSSKLLQDPNLNAKVSNLMGNKIFEKALATMFPELQPRNDGNIEYIESSFEFKDELELVEMGQGNESVSFPPNAISNIQMDNQESSIVSQPSLVLSELNRNQISDEYVDDNDLGYHQFVFNETELIVGCSKLTQKYGYPDKAIKKNTKSQQVHKKPQKSKPGSKFPQGVSFPNSNDAIYPRQYNNIVYDVMKLKVIFDREKTGYEEKSQLDLSEGDVLAGRYKVEAVLGSGVFAKVLRVFDLVTQEHTCLKMVSNNKDFFDQALDEIKILRYIAANCNPDDHNLLKFKSVFYHREHLFIETDLLKDNLFSAYRKNPSFFSLAALKQITRQLLTALSQLHRLHIIHADLKPQNILIKSYNPLQIKIVDLGNSCFFHDHLGQYVQSRSYRAPEVVLGCGYGEKVDVWSVGCILAELWTKNVLFYNVNIQGMLARMQGVVGPWPEWMLDRGTQVQNYFSKENLIFYEEEGRFHILVPKVTSLRARVRSDDDKFIAFLQACLRIDPHLRISAEEGLQHPFLKN